MPHGIGESGLGEGKECTSRTSPDPGREVLCTAGADVMRRSHTASVPEEAPVTHRCGREGCTARQLIRLESPCTSTIYWQLLQHTDQVLARSANVPAQTPAALPKQHMLRCLPAGPVEKMMSHADAFLPWSCPLDHIRTEDRDTLLMSVDHSTALPYTCAASMAPLPVMPQERGDLSCGLPGRLLSQHSRPPAATHAHSFLTFSAE